MGEDQKMAALLTREIEKPLKQTLENNRNREEVVPESVIYEKLSRLDVPTLTECHELELEV